MLRRCDILISSPLRHRFQLWEKKKFWRKGGMGEHSRSFFGPKWQRMRGRSIMIDSVLVYHGELVSGVCLRGLNRSAPYGEGLPVNQTEKRKRHCFDFTFCCPCFQRSAFLWHSPLWPSRKLDSYYHAHVSSFLPLYSKFVNRGGRSICDIATLPKFLRKPYS